MEPVLISVTSRTAAFEIVDVDGPELASPITLRVNGEPAGETAWSVLTLCDLEPGREHELGLGDGTQISFRTRPETAALDVRDFGARGDGEHDDTAALQAAIAACPAGGMVVFPAGVWSSGPLFLRSATTLYLEEGAVLRGLAERERYPILPAVISTGEGPEMFLGSWEGDPDDCYAALLTGIGVEDITIAGAGIIDGNAQAGDWWQWPKEKRGGRRPRTLFLNDCRDVLVQGVGFRNSPSWTIHPLFSSRLRFHGINVVNPKDSPNTDGLNPESCDDVEIVGARFSVGDDCIAIKSGKIRLGKLLKRPSRDIRIRRCLMEHGHGAVVIGSETAGGVRDVEISQCRFRLTDRGFRVKTRRGRGKDAVVRDIWIHDVTMDGVENPFVINCFYFCDPDGKSDYVQDRSARPVDDRTPEVCNIRIEHVRATGAKHAASYILGLPESPVRGLVLRDVSVSFSSDPEPAPPAMACGVEPMARAGYILINVDQPQIENATAQGVEGPLFPEIGAR